MNREQRKELVASFLEHATPGDQLALTVILNRLDELEHANRLSCRRPPDGCTCPGCRINLDARRRAPARRYRMHGTGTLPFHVGDYNKSAKRWPIFDASTSGVPVATCFCREDAEAFVTSANAWGGP